MELRTRPPSNYLEHASNEELYLLVKNWQSDLEFYQGEMRFFGTLLDKYFQWLVKDEELSYLRQLALRIASLQEKHSELSEKLQLQLQQYEKLLEAPPTKNGHNHRLEFEKLEDYLAAFVKSLRAVKSELFTTTERVIKEENIKRLLSP